jgi:GT2 family glycosyltransferase
VTWVQGCKPFVFARNINLGIDAAGRDDVILLNDDARLCTPRGLTRLHGVASGGLLSAGIRGVVGNPRQRVGSAPALRSEPETLAFICVLLPRRLIDTIGPLDERFVDYGFEDNDYCRRARAAGFPLLIFDGCVVEHGTAPSSFRSAPDHAARLAANRRRYEAKWRALQAPPTPPQDARVDLLFAARDRLEFTRESFATLLANTDWDRVERLILLDDGSTDGTREWLAAAATGTPVETLFLTANTGSPVAATALAMSHARAPVLAKIDNDTMVPPGWLRASLAALAGDPRLDILGIEAMRRLIADPDAPRGALPAPFVGGIGLVRRRAFARGLPRPIGDWFGYQEWQQEPDADRRAGWLNPSLPVFLLDRLPFEPWAGLTRHYVARGFQRPWPPYPIPSALWTWRWPTPPDAAAPAAGTRTAIHAGAGRPHFVGALRIKNEAAQITEVLEGALALCEQVVVFDDHSTDGTPQLCVRFAPRVTLHRSPFNGLDEARDKNHLLAILKTMDPDWVLWIDGDEVLERRGPARLRAVAADPAVAIVSLRIAYLWDDPSRVRIDGIYGRFRRPSAFRLSGQPLADLRFEPTRHGGNLHCGNVPSGLRGTTRALDVRLKHYGYLKPEQREAKHRWYRRVDPDNRQEDEYRHLIGAAGSRHTPGPPRFEVWTEA